MNNVLLNDFFVTGAGKSKPTQNCMLLSCHVHVSE